MIEIIASIVLAGIFATVLAIMFNDAIGVLLQGEEDEEDYIDSTNRDADMSEKCAS